MNRHLFPVLCTALLVACAPMPNSEPTPDTAPYASPDSIEPATEFAADGAAELAQCTPHRLFDLGLTAEPFPANCAGREGRMAFELGRQIHTLREEQEALGEADPQPARDARLRVIERELAQLEGLARIQGLLAADPGRD